MVISALCAQTSNPGDAPTRLRRAGVLASFRVTSTLQSPATRVWIRSFPTRSPFGLFVSVAVPLTAPLIRSSPRRSPYGLGVYVAAPQLAPFARAVTRLIYAGSSSCSR